MRRTCDHARWTRARVHWREDTLTHWGWSTRQTLVLMAAADDHACDWLRDLKRTTSVRSTRMAGQSAICNAGRRLEASMRLDLVKCACSGRPITAADGDAIANDRATDPDVAPSMPDWPGRSAIASATVRRRLAGRRSCRLAASGHRRRCIGLTAESRTQLELYQERDRVERTEWTSTPFPIEDRGVPCVRSVIAELHRAVGIA